jgi:hypothetical protein
MSSATTTGPIGERNCRLFPLLFKLGAIIEEGSETSSRSEEGANADHVSRRVARVPRGPQSTP